MGSVFTYAGERAIQNLKSSQNSSHPSGYGFMASIIVVQSIILLLVSSLLLSSSTYSETMFIFIKKLFLKFSENTFVECIVDVQGVFVS